MSNQARLIVDPDIAVDKLSAAAEGAGWVQVEDAPRDGHKPRSLGWEGPWPGLTVYYVDDHLIQVPYLMVFGPNPERALEDVQETLPSWPHELAVHDALQARERADKQTAVRRLAVLGAATEADRDTLAIFDAAFIDPDPEVRKVAIGASTYPAWREFEPRLEIVANGDQDESVRDLATRTLTALRRHNWV